MTLKLYGTNGALVPLSNITPVGVGLSESPDGLFGLPPIEFDGASGRTRGTASAMTRLLTFSLVVVGRTRSDAEATVREVSRALDPVHGDCRLVWTAEDGVQSELVATYSSGWQPQWDSGKSRVATAKVTFRAHQPYFRAVSDTVVALDLPITGTGAVGTPFNAPIPFNSPIPFGGYTSTPEDGTTRQLLRTTFTAPTWPRFRFEGPVSAVHLSNLTAGRTWSWEGTCLVDQILDIDFDDRGRHVLVDGVPQLLGIADTARWWPLIPGSPSMPQDNDVLVEVEGAAGTTSGSMFWSARYLSP